MWLTVPELAGAEHGIDESWRLLLNEDTPGAGHGRWGAVVEWRTDTGRAVVAPVNRAVAVSTYDPDDDERSRWDFASALYRDVESWIAAVGDWLDVLGRLVTISRPSGGVSPSPAQQHPLAVDRSTQRPERFARPPEVVISGVASAATSLGDWIAATKHLASGQTPPLAHLLLRDARAARYVDDLRRVVIDAATACEVALSAAIRRRLVTMPPAALDDLVDRRLNGVMELFDFHGKAVGPINAVSRKRLSFQLADVRNRVVHAGHPPSGEEANAAIEVAVVLVGDVAPLPAHS